MPTQRLSLNIVYIYLSKVLECLIHKQLSSFSSSSLVNPYRWLSVQGTILLQHWSTSILHLVAYKVRKAYSSSSARFKYCTKYCEFLYSVCHVMFFWGNFNGNWLVVSHLRGGRQHIHIEGSFFVDLLSLWGPLLFSLFINYISIQISSSYHLYEDGLQIYF